MAKKKKANELEAYRAKPPVTKEVADLCYEVFQDEVNRDDLYSIRSGLTAFERMKKRMLKEVGNEKEVEERLRRWALIHRIGVEATLKVLRDWKAKPPKFLKTKQKPSGKTEFNPTFIFELCVQILKDELDRWNPPSKDGTKSHERKIASFTAKRKGDAEAGLKRFREYAQIHAPEARAVLRVLDKHGKLPKEAK